MKQKAPKYAVVDCDAQGLAEKASHTESGHYMPHV